MPVKYALVSQADTKEEGSFQPSQRTHRSIRWEPAWLFLGLVFVGSICAKAFFITRQFVRPWELVNDLPTQYDAPTEIRPGSDFSSTNRTVQDAAWGHVDVETWNGFLALDEDYVVKQGLPHSQRWPWGSSKGVYIMTRSHELHCVHALRDLVNEYQDGVPEEKRTWHYEHLMHCLNLLRESVMCNADDTPLYIG